MLKEFQSYIDDRIEKTDRIYPFEFYKRPRDYDFDSIDEMCENTGKHMRNILYDTVRGDAKTIIDSITADFDAETDEETSKASLDIDDYDAFIGLIAGGEYESAIEPSKDIAEQGSVNQEGGVAGGEEPS